MQGDHHRLPLRHRVPLQRRHQTVRRMRIQPRRRFLQHPQLHPSESTLRTYIQKHQRRIGQQFTRDIRSLLLAAAQTPLDVVPDDGVLTVLQLEHVDDVIHVLHLLRMAHGVGQSQSCGVLQGLAEG